MKEGKKINLQAWVDAIELASVIRQIRRELNISVPFTRSSIVQLLLAAASRTVRSSFKTYEEAIAYLDSVHPTRTIPMPQFRIQGIESGRITNAGLKSVEVEKAERTGLLNELEEEVERRLDEEGNSDL